MKIYCVEKEKKKGPKEREKGRIVEGKEKRKEGRKEEKESKMLPGKKTKEIANSQLT